MENIAQLLAYERDGTSYDKKHLIEDFITRTQLDVHKS